MNEALIEGPLGFPMRDRAALQLSALLKSLPRGKEYEYRRLVKAAATSELNPGERSDVSWISTESVDRAGDIVIAKGMNDAQFALNPVVTLNHDYRSPPVGRSLWRKRIKDGATVGIKAKTKYPEKPGSWTGPEAWPADKVFAQVQAGLLNGKSIGFLPTKVHFPDAKECGANGWPLDVLVIDEWLLLEYACCAMPCNQDAVTEQVSKTAPPLVVPPPAKLTAWTSLEEVERAVRDSLAKVDVQALTDRVIADALDRKRGRV